MNLTRNERRALKLMLENAKISDSAIASILKISSQAVGKIRRKLERTVISSYSLNLNYEKLGIHTFAVGLARITSEGLDIGMIDVEQKLMDDPHIMQVYRLPGGDKRYVILYAFRDMSELDYFFHSPQRRKDFHAFIENKELYPFSHNSLIKDNPTRLFFKMIDGLGSEIPGSGFVEMDKSRKNGN